jgi:hypothetical protein
MLLIKNKEILLIFDFVNLRVSWGSVRIETGKNILPWQETGMRTGNKFKGGAGSGEEIMRKFFSGRKVLDFLLQKSTVIFLKISL